MSPSRSAVVFMLAALLAATSAQAASHGNDLVHARKLNGSVFMMNQSHMTLYTYGRDDAFTSTCTGTCAEIWPPALLPAGSVLGENYTLFARPDGDMQIAYKGRPLYLYSGDARIGDVNGDGIDGVWNISRPIE